MYINERWNRIKICRNTKKCFWKKWYNNDPNKIFEFFNGIEVDKEQYKNIKEDEIILNYQVMKKYKVNIGETIKFEIENEDSTNVKEAMADFCAKTETYNEF